MAGFLREILHYGKSRLSKRMWLVKLAASAMPFCLDTLSWARMGAKVLGVDLSEVAIDEAQKLAQQTQLSAEFICSDVYSVASRLSRKILCLRPMVPLWLPDLTLGADGCCLFKPRRTVLHGRVSSGAAVVRWL